MTNSEKAELLKDTIYHLYSKEGRSKSYISRLLDIDRKVLLNKIKEWNFPEPKPVHHLNPSTVKFINKNRSLIKSRLDKDISITEIAKELNVSRCFLQITVIPNDSVLNKAKDDKNARAKNKSFQHKEYLMEKSSRNYIKPLKNERWKNILGYEQYQVSDYGRVRKYIKSYDSYYEIEQTPNKNNGRLYVRITNKDTNKSQNLQVARLVAFAFVKGYSIDKSTVNHKDGNVQNNEANNLEWVSQSENNTHSYRVLNRKKNRGKKYKYKKIIYKNKYEFKTISAFSRFIGKSETQTRRYLNNPSKYNIILIK